MTSTPHPATREYRRQVIRISDLVVTESVIQDVRFDNCQIVGPAVIASVDRVVMNSCHFDADFDSMFWVVPDWRTSIVGAIGLIRVEFYACRFREIGVTVSESDLEGTKRAFGLL